MRSLVQSGPTAAELDRARATVLGDMNKNSSQLDSIADAWLEIETYKLSPNSVLSDQLERVSVGDVQRVAGRLFKNPAPAIVVLGDASQLKSAFGANVELRAASQIDVQPAATSTPRKP